MDRDGTGFSEIAPSHNPKHSAMRMVEFAKSALAHSRTVLMPNSDHHVMVRLSVDLWCVMYVGQSSVIAQQPE